MPDEKTTKAPETAAPDTEPGKAPEQAADKTAGAEKKAVPPVDKTSTDKAAMDGGKAAPPVEKAGTEKAPNVSVYNFSEMSKGANLVPQLIKIDFAVLPVVTCQRRIHHFLSLFLGLPCFPYSKS